MRIRSATAADAPGIADIYAHYVTATAITFEEIAPSAIEMAARMTAAKPRLPWLVAESDEVGGFAYASAHRARAAYRWSVDVTVYVAERQRGRGVGRALYDGLLAQVRALGYVSAYAGIALPNEASVGLHEAVGFVPIGVYPAVGYKLGRWRDVGWWHLPLADPPPQPPAQPRGWAPDQQAPAARPQS